MKVGGRGLKVDGDPTDVIELIVGDGVRVAAVRAVNAVIADPAEGHVRHGQRSAADRDGIVGDVVHRATGVLQGTARDGQAVVEADPHVRQGGPGSGVDPCPVTAGRRRAGTRGFLEEDRVVPGAADRDWKARVLEAGEGRARRQQRAVDLDGSTEHLDDVAGVRFQHAVDGQATVEQVSEVVGRYRRHRDRRRDAGGQPGQRLGCLAVDHHRIEAVARAVIACHRRRARFQLEVGFDGAEVHGGISEGR